MGEDNPGPDDMVSEMAGTRRSKKVKKRVKVKKKKAKPAEED